jgi:hypothetical protein
MVNIKKIEKFSIIGISLLVLGLFLFLMPIHSVFADSTGCKGLPASGNVSLRSSDVGKNTSDFDKGDCEKVKLNKGQYLWNLVLNPVGTNATATINGIVGKKNGEDISWTFITGSASADNWVAIVSNGLKYSGINCNLQTALRVETTCSGGSGGTVTTETTAAETTATTTATTTAETTAKTTAGTTSSETSSETTASETTETTSSDTTSAAATTAAETTAPETTSSDTTSAAATTAAETTAPETTSSDTTSAAATTAAETTATETTATETTAAETTSPETTAAATTAAETTATETTTTETTSAETTSPETTSPETTAAGTTSAETTSTGTTAVTAASETTKSTLPETTVEILPGTSDIRIAEGTPAAGVIQVLGIKRLAYTGYNFTYFIIGAIALLIGIAMISLKRFYIK